MADWDVKNDITPKATYVVPTLPTIAALKTALSTFSSTSYTADRMRSMTEQDLIYAARLHGLTVAGL